MNAIPRRAPIVSVKTSVPVVALTFDDGPHADLTTRMLTFLMREDIKVTFFELGSNVAKHPDLARAIVVAGHEIGNHSMTHRDLGEVSDIEDIRAELLEAQAVIHGTTGFTPAVFRAPYLSHGPALWAVSTSSNCRRSAVSPRRTGR